MNFRAFRFLLLIILYSPVVISQSQFQKLYGSDFSDRGYSISKTADGNFALAGSYEEDGGHFLLMKVNPLGDTIWTKTYEVHADSSAFVLGDDRDGSGPMKVCEMHECFDGGFILAGKAHDISFGEDDIYVVRTNSSGDTVWTRSFGGGADETGNSIVQTSDSSFVLAGYSESFSTGFPDGYVIRLDQLGDTLWTRIINGGGLDIFNSIIETSSGDFIAVGNTYSSGEGGTDILVVKFDSDGEILWERTFGGLYNDYGNSVIEVSNKLVIAGGTESFGEGLEDGLLLSLDEFGTLIWSKAYGGSGIDGFKQVISSTDNSLTAVGYTESFGSGFSDKLVINMDSLGVINWNWSYGSENYEYGESIVQLADSGFFVLGYTNSFGSGLDDLYLIRTNSIGETECHSDSPDISTTNAGFIENSFTSTLAAGGSTESVSALTGSTFIKQLNACNYILSSNGVAETSSIIIYPNPTTGIITLVVGELNQNFTNAQLDVFDGIGTLLRRIQLENSMQQIDFSSYSSGIYYLRLSYENGSTSQLPVVIQQ